MLRRVFPSLILASMALSSVPLALAQQSPAPTPLEGVSKPPTDPIQATSDLPAKPSPSVLAAPAPSEAEVPATNALEGAPIAAAPTATTPAAPSQAQPTPAPAPLLHRQASADPDGDIVHPRVARPGQLLSGATVQVRLLDRISSVDTEKGEPFHGTVAYDVLQDGQMLIPAGSTVQGKVISVSTGKFAGHGSVRLRPDSITLPSGTRLDFHAEATGTRLSKTRVGAEGSINPGPRTTRDSVEYGAVVGTGAATGAVFGGPAGALAGGLIGAGLVTTHLMTDHPQTTLEPGVIVLFTLTDSIQVFASDSN